VAFERHARIGDHGEPEPRRAQQRHAAVDEAGVLESLDAAADLRGRKMDALAERRIGGAAVALQRIEQLDVGAVERDHRLEPPGCNRCTIRARSSGIRPSIRVIRAPFNA